MKQNNLAPSGPQPITVNAADILHAKPSGLKAITGTDNLELCDQLLKSVGAALLLPANTSPEARKSAITGALAAVHAFGPKDAVEGMLAAQAVALHHAAMECFRRAMIPDQPGEAAARLRRDAANLSRAMADMAEAIDRRRGKGPQVVRVERVVVNEGGQAIVGAVTAGAAHGPPGGRGCEGRL
jgi:hypothetical protein